MQSPPQQPLAPESMGLSLRVKFALLVAALATLPLALIGWVGLRANAETLQITQLELQIAVLGDLAGTVDHGFDDAEAGLVAIGRVLADAGLGEDERIQLTKAEVEARQSLDLVAIYDREGAIIDVLSELGVDSRSVPEALDPELLASATKLRAATGAAALHGDESDAEHRPLRVPIVTAIRPSGPESPPTGFVVGFVSMTGVSEHMRALADAHLGGSEGALLLVDRKLRIVADTRGEAALTEVSASPALEGVDPGTLGPMVARSGEYVEDGRDTVGTVVGLPGREWVAVAQVSRDWAYASLEDMRRVVLGSVLAVMLGAGLLGLWAARRLTAPLAELTAFTAKLAERRFDARVSPRSRDELGVLAQAMSDAAASLEASEAQVAREIEVRRDLGRYISPELLERVVSREQDMGLGGQRSEITVLFMDVVAFTPLSERLSPEAVVELLNHLFTISTEIVFRHGGTVDKFIGDSMMAFWGAPTPREDHAERALAAAEEIVSWLEIANEHFRSTYGCAIELAVGLNSGSCVVGNIGSDRRMEYTAIGDVVNVAARLEAIARPQQILVSQTTAALAKDAFDFIPLGERQLSGRSEPVQLFELEP